MFEVNIGETLKVSYAREGKKQDGTPYAVICCYERDNQPPDIDNPSRSTDSVKIWLEKLPEGLSDGGLIRVKTLRGFRKVAEKNTYNGKDVWKTCIAIKGDLEVVA